MSERTLEDQIREAELAGDYQRSRILKSRWVFGQGPVPEPDSAPSADTTSGTAAENEDDTEDDDTDDPAEQVRNSPEQQAAEAQAQGNWNESLNVKANALFGGEDDDNE